MSKLADYWIECITKSVLCFILEDELRLALLHLPLVILFENVCDDVVVSLNLHSIFLRFWK